MTTSTSIGHALPTVAWLDAHYLAGQPQSGIMQTISPMPLALFSSFSAPPNQEIA